MRCWTRWKRLEDWEVFSIGDKVKRAGKMSALRVRASGPPRKARRTLSYRILLPDTAQDVANASAEAYYAEEYH